MSNIYTILDNRDLDNYDELSTYGVLALSSYVLLSAYIDDTFITKIDAHDTFITKQDAIIHDGTVLSNYLRDVDINPNDFGAKVVFRKWVPANEEEY